MCFSDFPLLFVIFVAMLEINEIIQSALHNLKIEELNPMQEASLEQATGRKRRYLVVADRVGKDTCLFVAFIAHAETWQ